MLRADVRWRIQKRNDFTVNRTRDLKIFSLALSQLSYEVREDIPSLGFHAQHVSGAICKDKHKQLSTWNIYTAHRTDPSSTNNSEITPTSHVENIIFRIHKYTHHRQSCCRKHYSLPSNSRGGFHKQRIPTICV